MGEAGAQQQDGRLRKEGDEQEQALGLSNSLSAFEGFVFLSVGMC